MEYFCFDSFLCETKNREGKSLHWDSWAEPELICCSHSGPALHGCVLSADSPSRPEQGLPAGGTSFSF